MLEKTYAPADVEKRWVEAWSKARLFGSAPVKGGRAYTIVIPPPNVTGALHIGHALNNTLQDVLIRWHRLHGREACWVPGTDHGGIATQNVMEKQLKAEKLSRRDLGRDAFLERMQAWTRDCKKTILGQLTRLGCALDFGREAFTMDEARAKSVHHAFAEFYKEGLIYRGARMVNWCVRCGTALSDIEVESEERKTKLWHLRYPAADGGEGLVVATTRPETMLGDTAVAVNPKDARYAALVGKKLKLPLTERLIPVVADEHVDSAFGTGAVKVTPAHDVNDFEIRQRHPEIETLQVIGFDGKLTPEAGKYAGLSRELARDAVLKDLGDALVKTEDHKNAVGTCYRCQSTIEPLVAWQWFVKMAPLAEKARAALDDGRFKIHPASWAKPYRAWLENIKDWCVSRQIWWGHRIPVWYCQACNAGKLGSTSELYNTPELKVAAVSAARPESCPACGGKDLIQDPDVLDTWFSSALWPLSVFGWPEKTPDLDFYYPTDILVTGYEILYLWVARMQFMGLHFMDKVPFSAALMHGIVRDKAGKKMSKSLGNVVDPLLMMDKHGTDALRFALVSQAHPGKDIPFAEDSITGPRNFANKLWNSTRFVLDYALKNEPAPEGGYPLAGLDKAKLEVADRWILARFQEVSETARKDVESLDLAAAANCLYGFLWDDFCDWYIELSKAALADPERGEATKTILVQVLTGTLKLLHPFMPFITEELYQALKPYAGETAEFAFSAGAPVLTGWEDSSAVKNMRFLRLAVDSIRRLRSILEVHPGAKLQAKYSGSGGWAEFLRDESETVMLLGRFESLEKVDSRPPASAAAVAGTTAFYFAMEGLVDFEKARGRLAKELERLAKDQTKCDAILGNKSFVERAPEEEVAKVRVQRDETVARGAALKDTLEALGAGRSNKGV
ncbi:MAG: valine--tRNA ligase [Elusimicrobia bacterium]|nr:valine--tRNA ligase [Elusimicrobiota bacterium]